MFTCGCIHIEDNLNAQTFGDLVRALNLTGPVLVKPNWGTVECYTEADILDWTLAAIPGEKLVIESHGWARSQEIQLHQKAPALTRANLRKGERWFLESSGIQSVLEKHQVEYLNLTEEVWAGRIADPGLVRQAVAERYAPLTHAELYEKVPSRLYSLRGATLLSLSKYKLAFYPLGASFSVKNLFGLIPGPSRGKFHGPQHTLLDQSIIEINKIYRSLFTVKGIIEALHSSGHHEVESERTRVFPGFGKAYASADTVTLDAYLAASAGRAPEGIGYLALAAQTFGAWDEAAVRTAQQGSQIVLGQASVPA